MTYSVKLDMFEGPFDLLYHLIEKNEVDLYDIPIADITGQYLEYLDNLKFFDMEIASEFLVMAATLIHIKSRMLLPKEPALDPEDELDPRQQLIERLIEYKKYKDVTDEFRKREAIYQKRHFRGPSGIKVNEEFELLTLDANAYDLCQVFARAMKRYIALYNEDYDFQRKLQKEGITVADRINYIRKMISTLGGLTFKSLIEGCVSRENIVVTFLALLELIKEREIIIEQTRIFGDITIKPKSIKGWR